MEWDEATKALINDVAEKAAEKTVAQTLISLGVDSTDPFEVQHDMQFIRAARRNWQSAKTKGLLAAIGLMVTGFFAFLWSAIKQTITGAHG